MPSFALVGQSVAIADHEAVGAIKRRQPVLLSGVRGIVAGSASGKHIARRGNSTTGLASVDVGDEFAPRVGRLESQPIREIVPELGLQGVVQMIAVRLHLLQTAWATPRKLARPMIFPGVFART